MDPIKLGINPKEILGQGTHGTVYQSNLNPNVAVKVVKNDSIRVPTCLNPTNKQSSLCQMTNTEYIAQELTAEFLDQNRNILPGKEIMNVPQVYGFSYSPSALNPLHCSYNMEKVHRVDDLPGLVQIPFGYDRDLFSKDQSGVYMGIDKIKDYFDLDDGMNLIVQAVASFHALLHYGLGCDGYDMEYVLTPDDNGVLQVYTLDFDKVSFYMGEYKELSAENDCVMRKLTESDYERRDIKTERDIVKLLGTSFSYDPHPDYPEYQTWIDTYLQVADQFGYRDLAEKVLTFRQNFF